MITKHVKDNTVVEITKKLEGFDVGEQVNIHGYNDDGYWIHNVIRIPMNCCKIISGGAI